MFYAVQKEYKIRYKQKYLIVDEGEEPYKPSIIYFHTNQLRFFMYSMSTSKAELTLKN